MSVLRPLLHRHGIPLLAVGLAISISLLADQIGMATPYLLAFTPVMVIAWYGGLVAGLLATLLAATLLGWCLLVPQDPARTRDVMVRLVVFVLLVGLINGIVEAQRRAEEARNRLIRDLREADRRKDEFLAMLAHELRNPLAPIRNAVAILNQIGPPDPQLTRLRQIIDRQVTHQARLLDDLLDVSRIARGKITLRLDTLDLVCLVRDSVEDVRGVLEASGITLTLELTEARLWVEGDPTRLAQVVGNLLHNAAKFTDPGGHVTVSVMRHASGVMGRKSQEEPALTHDPRHMTHDLAVIRVRDTGIGIAPEKRVEVFDSFMQVEGGLDRNQGGLGLGLALVKGLAELHGGAASVESEGLGRGSEFTVWLPMAAPPMLSVAAEPAELGPRGVLRVLIVEDNRDAAETLRELLVLSGCSAVVAHSGPEALVTARQVRPEVVLCDLGLPGMSGYQVAAELRRDPALASARLIALTGYGQDEDRQRSREAGFEWHLTKPVEFTRLQQLLDRSLERPKA